MILEFIWLGIAIIFAGIQWYIIEKLNRFPNKDCWFLVRAAVALLYFVLFYRQGYVWYWILAYEIFGFWLPFNLTLNLLRGKKPWYLSAENSTVDRILLFIFRIDLVIFAISIIAFLSAWGIMYWYGHCTYWEINNGFCR